MRLLLDTHIVLWELTEFRRCSPAAQHAMDNATELWFSAASFAEIGVKTAIGKLFVPERLHEHLAEGGVQVLTLQAQHGLAIAELPVHHRDPFDRMLIAQARCEQLTIVTADHVFAAYDVPVVDAG